MRTLARLNVVVAANITALALSTQVWWSGFVSFPGLYALMLCGIMLMYFLLRARWLFVQPNAGDGIMAEFIYLNRILLGIMMLTLLLAAGYLAIWMVPFHSLSYFLPVIIMAALYQAPIGKGRRVRQIGAAKLFIISLSVTWISWVLPTLSASPGVSRDMIDWPLGLLSRFFFILGITIPFDVRDMEEDKQKKVKTIAVVNGEQKALNIAAFACLASMLTEFLRWNNGGISGLNLAAVVIALTVSIFVILESGKTRGELHFTWLVESMPGLMAFLLWAFRL